MNTTVCSALLVLAFAANANASSGSLFVSAGANIYGAGHSTPPAPGGGGAGFGPSMFGFTARPGQVMSITSVSGTVTLTDSLGFRHGADGNSSLPTDLSSFGGISGIQSDASGFLVGVFLGPTAPVTPGPAALDFRFTDITTDFLSLSPEIGQLFFIGDGRTRFGNVQQFLVPSAANRLYFGFADGLGYMGLPGQYQDNAGALTVRVTIVPEPSILALISLGAMSILTFRRLRAARFAATMRT